MPKQKRMKFPNLRIHLTNMLLQTVAALLCIALLLGAHCGHSAGSRVQSTADARDSFPYDMDNPSQIINLESDDLKEISGLSPADSAGIYCAIADERGEVLFIDGVGGGAILRRVLFREKGDFEGVELVGTRLFAMKSDGDLFEIENWKTPDKMLVEEYNTPLHKSDDVEGLGYDPSRDALLVACKGDPDSSYLRKIYAFGLKTKQMEPTPVYSIDPLEVNRLLPYEDPDKARFFSPSGVAVNPITKDVYVISTALKRLVVLDPVSGAIRFAVRLDKKLLPQPEGIAFDANGNLHLSSEGKKGEGLLLKFNYKSGH